MAKQLTPIRKPVAQKVISTETAEAENSVTKVELGFNVDPTKTYIFETIKKSDIPRNENLGSVCMAFDNVEKRYRELRYFPTSESIFSEEQHESYSEMALPPLSFWRNTMYASGEDIRLIEYLMCHPLYDNSPFRVANKPAFFTLADKEVQEEIKAKIHATEMKALTLISETDFDDLKPIARNIFNITEVSETAIKNALNELVKKPKQGSQTNSNAERLIENIGNPKLLRAYRIQLGIDTGVIAADLNQMVAKFVDGGAHIMNLRTKHPVNELVDNTFTEAGASWYATLVRKLKQ